MSSTARSAEIRATSKDNYPTPPWAVRAILPHLPKYFLPEEVEAGLRVLEPAAGSGSIVQVLQEREPGTPFEFETFADKIWKYRWISACDMIEIRSEEMPTLEGLARWQPWSPPPSFEDKMMAPRVLIGDFLAPQWRGECELNPTHVSSFLFRDNVDIVLTNPPYNAPYKGIGFDFVKQAHRFVKPHGIIVMLLPMSFLESATRYPWLIHNEPDIYVLSRRPSFTGSGTDSSSYAWFVWKKAHEGRRCIGKISHLGCPPARPRS